MSRENAFIFFFLRREEMHASIYFLELEGKKRWNGNQNGNILGVEWIGKKKKKEGGRQVVLTCCRARGGGGR